MSKAAEAQKANAKADGAANSNPVAKAQMPKGAVAHPAGHMTAAAVLVEVLPVGNVMYDGETLPIVSPDGMFLASQDGETPPRAAMLAEPEARPVVGTRISVYDISKNPAKKVTFSKPLEANLLLGRAADDEGFLVESPRLDGSRWIGKVQWATGQVVWLVQSQAVCAYAMLTPQGELIYSRRSVTSASADLVLRSRSGAESSKESLSGMYCYPCAGAAEEIIYTMRVSRGGTDVEVVRIDRRDAAAPRLADTRQTWRILNSPDLMLAHQMASTVSALPSGVTASGAVGAPGETDADTLALFNPAKNRMMRFSAATGGLEGLVAKSISACPAVGEGMSPGYFCTSDQGLVFVPRPSEGWAPMWSDDDPPAKVMPAPYVPRAVRPSVAPQAKLDGKKGDTKNQKMVRVPTYILFGPVKGQDNQLEVVRMAVVSGTTPVEDASAAIVK